MKKFKFLPILLLLLLKSTRVTSGQDLFTVHLVPHSHDDAGWVRTIDEYYYESVREIYDNVLTCLLDSPERRFIIIEQIFFSRWFRQATTVVQQQFRTVLGRGQVEFVLGGWCMNDEASVRAISSVDQISHGQQFLAREFGITNTRYAYQIDPFGHSAADPLIYPRLNFEAVILNRIHWRLKQEREREHSMEFIWTSAAGGDQIVAHILDRHYSAPPGFDFDLDPPIADDEMLARKSEWLVEHLRERRASYPSQHHFLQLIGDDFKWRKAEAQFTNWEKVIRYINERPRLFGLRLRFSTLHEYFQGRQSEDPQWKSQLPEMKGGDFFPYADNDESYWTGYFTSKPLFKRQVREAEWMKNLAEMTSALRVITDRGNIVSDTEDLQRIVGELNKVRGYVGEVQHHDAITGTSKEYVTQAYAADLRHSEFVSKSLLSQNAQVILGSSDPLTTDWSALADLKPGRECEIVVFNPTFHFHQVVEVPAFTPNISVYADGSGSFVQSQIIPLDHQSRIRLSYPFTLLFHANIPPLSFARFTFKYDSKSKSKSHLKNLPSHFGSFQMENANSLLQFTSSASESYSHFKLSITPKQTGSKNNGTLHLDPQLMAYESFKGSGQPSGAYIFRPDSTARPLSDILQPGKSTYQVLAGPIVQEFRVSLGGMVSQTFRLYGNDSHGYFANTVEVKTTLGPLPANSEVVLRMNAKPSSQQSVLSNDVDVKCQLVTDDGGIVLMRRPDPNPDVLAANFYPSTVMGGVECRTGQNVMFASLLDRPMAVGSQKNGQLELMLHRRTLNDDLRGVEESLDDQSVISPTISLFFKSTSAADGSGQQQQYLDHVLRRYGQVKLNPVRYLIGPVRESSLEPSSRDETVIDNGKVIMKFLLESMQLWDVQVVPDESDDGDGEEAVTKVQILIRVQQLKSAHDLRDYIKSLIPQSETAIKSFHIEHVALNGLPRRSVHSQTLSKFRLQKRYFDDEIDSYMQAYLVTFSY